MADKLHPWVRAKFTELFSAVQRGKADDPF
jgi:hypothetical protein